MIVSISRRATSFFDLWRLEARCLQPLARSPKAVPPVFSSRPRGFGLYLTLTVLAALGASAAAQEMAPGASGSGTTIDLDAITVTATKEGERVYDSLSPSSVIGREQIERQIQPSSTADVLRLIPSVTTQAAPGDPKEAER